MSKLVARHGVSQANNRENYGTPLFGNPEAGLMEDGMVQATTLGVKLKSEFGIVVASEIVAVSELRRSQQTATVAGFRWLHIYPELNEEKGGLSDAEIAQALETRRPPEATRIAARYLIEHPPEEKIWITHALLIATICQELGVYQSERFTPKFCEIRVLPM